MLRLRLPDLEEDYYSDPEALFQYWADGFLTLNASFAINIIFCGSVVNREKEE